MLVFYRGGNILENNLTTGSLKKAMLSFSVPYLIASFLQTFYGMADLFITGRFNGAAEVTAVSVGSQIMHMVTVIIVGLAMGTTVTLSHAVGARNQKRSADAIGNAILVFALFAAVLTVLLLGCISPILGLLHTPGEARSSAGDYLRICFAGIPFITAYNVISSIFRGLGDTKRPMIFVGIAGVINIVLDYVLIGPCSMGAAGAAYATVISQALSVCLAIFAIRKMDTGIRLLRDNFRPKSVVIRNLLGIGVPISCQDGLIQISFLIITTIANSRGLTIATAVGIVEKIISFLFLVPSAMLSTISAVAAQNAGAGMHDRGRQTLRYGIVFCIGFGIVVSVLCQFLAAPVVGAFVSNEPEVVRLGAQYLRTYSLDVIFGGIQFSFSGYFSAYGKSIYSFIHNMLSVVLVRIPGAYLASVLFPLSLYPMGLAAPAGSLLSSLICLALYVNFRKKDQAETVRL